MASATGETEKDHRSSVIGSSFLVYATREHGIISNESRGKNRASGAIFGGPKTHVNPRPVGTRVWKCGNLQPLEDAGRAHTAADAHRDHTIAGVAALQFAYERGSEL